MISYLIYLLIQAVGSDGEDDNWSDIWVFQKLEILYALQNPYPSFRVPELCEAVIYFTCMWIDDMVFVSIFVGHCIVIIVIDRIHSYSLGCKIS